MIIDALPLYLSRFIIFNSKDSSTPTIFAMIGRVTVLNISMFTSLESMLLKELPSAVNLNLCLPKSAIRVRDNKN